MPSPAHELGAATHHAMTPPDIIDRPRLPERVAKENARAEIKRALHLLTGADGILSHHPGPMPIDTRLDARRQLEAATDAADSALRWLYAHGSASDNLRVCAAVVRDYIGTVARLAADEDAS
jgi:hypothetical protein